MSSIPPRMSPPPMDSPEEGPSRGPKKFNPTSIGLTVLGGLAAFFCLGGIVAVTFLLPALRRARVARVGRGVSCISTLQQAGSALGMYAADNDEHLPTADRWMDELAMKDLYCPEVRQNDPAGFGYAFNDALGGKAVSASSGVVWAVCDSTLRGRNAHSAILSVPVRGRHPVRRGRANNVLMNDGSAFKRVESLQAASAIERFRLHF